MYLPRAAPVTSILFPSKLIDRDMFVRCSQTRVIYYSPLFILLLLADIHWLVLNSRRPAWLLNSPGNSKKTCEKKVQNLQRTLCIHKIVSRCLSIFCFHKNAFFCSLYFLPYIQQKTTSYVVVYHNHFCTREKYHNDNEAVLQIQETL